MYVAVKGGETAIAHSLDLMADKRRGDRDLAELTLAQIHQQLPPRRRPRDDRRLSATTRSLAALGRQAGRAAI